MKRIMMTEGTFTIGLQVKPFNFPCTKEGMKGFVVEIKIIYKPHWLAPVNEEWAKLLLDSVCEQELNPQIDEFIMELLRAKKLAAKIYRDAAAGRITEEFFNNQEVDAEKF
ncbi:MAG: hypothetical protein IH886_14145 [Nitrospinae bacterium]|nr:hypothetical protein [Nitrospinota bacterium]